jgi:hypothetical protein
MLQRIGPDRAQATRHLCHTRLVHGSARAGALLTVLALITGCSAIPNMDVGSSGCQNARGIGPAGMAASDGEPVVADVVGKSPTEAATIARAMGHTVVFNVQIPGYGECWCAPPPHGEVVQAWWGQHGALWLEVDGVDVGHTKDHQPIRGWGC